MTRPLIGFTTYREQARWGVWDVLADLLHADYARSIEAAGGIAVLLPPTTDPARDAGAVIARLDGLVVTGGADVEPGLYGEDAHAHTIAVRPERDAWELALLDAALAVGLPTLGVCRGMQIMAVHAGGALEQHTPDVVGDESHSPGGPVYGATEVVAVKGTRLGMIVGTQATVQCHHHQSVRTHPGFVESARAADGTLEAMEHPGRPFWMAVQWHPETDQTGDARLFRALVAAAALPT
ncbi:gamma-glutamyl-gamma-aminobutyrate hydrolase family protein [soil metagenome]